MKNNFKSSWIYRANNLGLSYKAIVILILLSLMSTVTEIFGMGIFIPIFQYIGLEGDINALVEDSPLWRYIVDFFLLYWCGTNINCIISTIIYFFSKQTNIHVFKVSLQCCH